MSLGTIQISGNIPSNSGTKQLGPLTISASAPVAQLTVTTLGSGDNTISIPAGATAVVIKPPDSNAVVLKMKGNAADVGIQISKTNPTGPISFDTTLPTLIINCASAMSAATEFSFI